jgi:hypothetical protein
MTTMNVNIYIISHVVDVDVAESVRSICCIAQHVAKGSPQYLSPSQTSSKPDNWNPMISPL